MAATPTTRLGLLKQAGGDPVSRTMMNSDYDKLDKFMGVILVEEGVTPPDADLFDGAIIKERGKLGNYFVAEKNGGGSFDVHHLGGPSAQFFLYQTAVSGSGWLKTGSPLLLGSTDGATTPGLITPSGPNGVRINKTGWYDIEVRINITSSTGGPERIMVGFDVAGLSEPAVTNMITLYRATTSYNTYIYRASRLLIAPTLYAAFVYHAGAITFNADIKGWYRKPNVA